MSDSSSSDGEDTWIHWFCGLDGHEMFCEVDRSYVEDGFNLFGLRHWVPNINDCLDVILDRVPQTEASHELMEATCALYGLIHARYVLTTAGLEAMYAKYTLQEFGNCPHFLCRGQSVVPLGVRDEPHMETVKLFCPKCQDVYVHPSHAAQRVDGAYFGTTFPHLFFMTYKGLVPDPPEKTYVPKVFGFRVHARNLPGGAAARGQDDQIQPERRRLDRSHPPQTPPQQSSGAAAAAGGGGTGTSAAEAVASLAGSSPANGARAGGGEGGDGKGRGKGRAEGGSVVVRIKEEEETWTKGRGGGGGGTRGAVARAERESAAVAAAGRDSNSQHQQGVNGRQVAAGEAGARGDSPSPTRAVQPSGAGTDAPGRPDLRAAGGNNGGSVAQHTTSIGNGGTAIGGAVANGAPACSARGDAAGAGTDTATVMTRGSGKARATEPGHDANVNGGTGGAQRGGSPGASPGTVALAENSNVVAAAVEARDAAAAQARSGSPQERGTKRLSELELEAAAAAAGSGVGERVLGRTRGKVPRGRNHASPVAPGVGPGAPSAVVVEGAGAGSSGRRTRGNSPM